MNFRYFDHNWLIGTGRSACECRPKQMLVAQRCVGVRDVYFPYGRLWLCVLLASDKHSANSLHSYITLAIPNRLSLYTVSVDSATGGGRGGGVVWHLLLTTESGLFSSKKQSPSFRRRVPLRFLQLISDFLHLQKNKPDFTLRDIRT